MRVVIKEPIPEVYRAFEVLCDGVDAHLLGRRDEAEARFRDANCPVVWEWLNSAWTNVIKHVVQLKPPSHSKVIPKSIRDPDRAISRDVRQRVLSRDGYRCRYCGLPVVHADIRKIAHALYPDAVPWNPRDARFQHAGFQALWLQFDHVEPHSHGGRSTVDNVVIACALCNFGKDRHTLRQLDLADPRLRLPVPSDFDGLERLRDALPMKVVRKRAEPAVKVKTPLEPLDCALSAFFFRGGQISSGYVTTPPIQGKSRWFKLGGLVSARPFTRLGVEGCVVFCPTDKILKRGLDPAEFQIAEVCPPITPFK